MIATKEDSATQVEAAYQYAVQGCLIRFFGRSESEALERVDAWWDRMQEFRPDPEESFLQYEAINVASDLAEGPDVPVTDGNQAAYFAIIAESNRRAEFD